MAEVRISHTDGTPTTVIQTSDPDAIREFEESAFTDPNVSVVEVSTLAASADDDERSAT